MAAIVVLVVSIVAAVLAVECNSDRRLVVCQGIEQEEEDAWEELSGFSSCCSSCCSAAGVNCRNKGVLLTVIVF